MASNITLHEFREQLAGAEPPRVLDVRSAAEFAIGHIPGAVNIPMEQVEARVEDVPPAPLVLVCEAGTRAEIVAGWLGHRSQPKVLEGGTRAWRNAGYTLVTSAPCRWTLERQVRLMAGVLALAGTVLAVLVNAKWVYAAMFIGAGLTFAGVTNICGMGILLAKMPWNSAQRSAGRTGVSVEANCRS
jgi:rhodanese-related sulfurtransferase